MKKIIIAGCGGFGQEVYSYIADDIKKGKSKDLKLLGVLDDSKSSYQTSGIDLPLLGSISNYKFDLDTFVILCVGDVKTRAKLVQILRENNASFYSYIHSSCYITSSAKIGEGVIICPQSIINANTNIGSHTVINVFCSVGHGATIGEGSILSPYAALNGDASIGKHCFLGTRATIYPQVSLVGNCIVDTHSTAKQSVNKPSVISDRTTYVCVPNRFC